MKEVPKTLPRELKYIRPLDNFKLIQDEMYKNVLTMVRDYTRDNRKSIISQQMKNMAASFRIYILSRSFGISLNFVICIMNS